MDVLKTTVFRTSRKIIRMQCLVMMASVIIGMVWNAQAASLTINLDNAFSNYEPGDLAYGLLYGTVTIQDGGFTYNSQAYDVKFTVDARNFAGGTDAFIGEFYFNVFPFVDSIILAGDNISSTNLSVDGNKADGDGYFDAWVNLAQGSSKTNYTEFYAASGTGTLTIDNFADFTSSTQSVDKNNSSKGAFTVAAHLQSTLTPDGSEYVGGNPVPIPSTALLFCGSIALIVGIRRKISN